MRLRKRSGGYPCSFSLPYWEKERMNCGGGLQRPFNIKLFAVKLQFRGLKQASLIAAAVSKQCAFIAWRLRSLIFALGCLCGCLWRLLCIAVIFIFVFL